MIQSTIQAYTPPQISNLSRFLDRYHKDCPDARLLSPEFYTYHPVLKGGTNTVCVLDVEERIVGFAPLFPAPISEEAPLEEPHHLWTILLTDPMETNRLAIHGLLFEWIMRRAQEILKTLPPRRVRLASDMMISQKVDMHFLIERGFEVFEKIFVMRGCIADTIPGITTPAGLEFKAWRMETASDKLVYLRAFNRCFPVNPKTEDALQFQLSSPAWANGSSIAAFTPQGELVGSILMLIDADQERGITDDVFVLPEYRGRGIAKHLIGEGLRFLKARGIRETLLEVKASNAPAVAVYQAMGFEVINEEVHLGTFIRD